MKKIMICISMMFISMGVFGVNYSGSLFSPTGTHDVRRANNLTPYSDLSREQKKAFDNLISDICDANKTISVSDKSIINVYGEYGITPLTKALIQGRDDVVKYLIEKGASIDYEVEDVDHPLLCAQNISIAEYLVEKGAKVDYTDEEENSLLHLAVQNNKKFLVKWLVETKGINVDYANTRGETALFVAKEEGYEDIAEYLTARRR